MDSRAAEDGSAIRRRRQCPQCGSRFSTTETASLVVIKRNGVTEPFSRDKIVNGVRKACQGRPVTDSDLTLLAQAVEESVRSTGNSQIDANDIGLAILEPLRKRDEVAFMRYASVYQGWESLDDFEAAIKLLRLDHQQQASSN
jgi:transcriptional repressor NrdR